MPPRAFVAFDLETTGLNPRRDAIIEFGAVRFQEGRARQRFATFVNPGRPIPPRIRQMTGIGPADVAGAPPIEAVIPQILAFIGAGADAVAAHSAGFDISFLRAAGVEIDAPVLDTYELATVLLPGQHSYSLGELCRALAIPLPAAHRAGHDAEATADLLLHLLERIEALPSAALETLCAAGLGSDWGPMRLFQDALSRRRRERGEARGERTITRASRLAPHASPWKKPLAGNRARREPRAATRCSDEFLTAAFADDGPLAAEFDGESGARFEPRAGQLEMARQVLDALQRGDHKIIEAGTGTGKSLAYLLPAAAWAAANDSRVVIATHTIPLQDQLLEQEFPRAVRCLTASGPDAGGRGQPPPPGVNAMVLKGRAHYLCTRRLARWLESEERGKMSGKRAGSHPAQFRLSPLELRFLARILVWLPGAETGDLSELPVHDRREQALMAHVSSHADECSPPRCMARATPGQHDYLGGRFRDFYLEAHRRAASAHLLVVNHALLLADAQTGGQLLPAYDNLIVDEAHHLERAATEQFTQQIDLHLLTSLLNGVDDAISQLEPRIPQAAARDLARRLAADRRAAQAIIPTFFETLLDFALRHCGPAAGSGYPQQVALDNRIRAQPEWSEIEIQWDEISARLGDMPERLTELAALSQGGGKNREESEDAYSSLLHSLSSQLAALLQGADDLILRPLQQQERSVAWLELERQGERKAERGAAPLSAAPPASPPTPGRKVILCSAPIQVSEALAADLFGARRAVVLTGATLQAGDRFDFLRERLGCWGRKRDRHRQPLRLQTQRPPLHAQRHAAAGSPQLPACAGAGHTTGRVGRRGQDARPVHQPQPPARHRARHRRAAGRSRADRSPAGRGQPPPQSARLPRQSPLDSARHQQLLGRDRSARRSACLPADRPPALCRADGPALRRPQPSVRGRLPRVRPARRGHPPAPGIRALDPQRRRSRGSSSCWTAACGNAVTARSFSTPCPPAPRVIARSPHLEEAIRQWLAKSG